MNVQDVVDRVLRQFGDEASTQINEADIIRWINDAQREIAVKNDLLQATGTVSTIIGTVEYSFPTDMLSMQSMYYNNARLKYMSKQEYDEYITINDPDSTHTGSPYIYTRWAKKFFLYPNPDTVGTLKLLYTQLPTEVTTSTDDLSLSLEYHNRIVEYCLQQAYRTDEDWDAASVMAQDFQAGVDALKEQESFDNRQYYPTITVLPEDSW